MAEVFLRTFCIAVVFEDNTEPSGADEIRVRLRQALSALNTGHIYRVLGTEDYPHELGPVWIVYYCSKPSGRTDQDLWHQLEPKLARLLTIEEVMENQPMEWNEAQRLVRDRILLALNGSDILSSGASGSFPVADRDERSWAHHLANSIEAFKSKNGSIYSYNKVYGLDITVHALADDYEMETRIQVSNDAPIYRKVPLHYPVVREILSDMPHGIHIWGAGIAEGPPIVNSQNYGNGFNYVGTERTSEGIFMSFTRFKFLQIGSLSNYLDRTNEQCDLRLDSNSSEPPVNLKTTKAPSVLQGYRLPGEEMIRYNKSDGSNAIIWALQADKRTAAATSSHNEQWYYQAEVHYNARSECSATAMLLLFDYTYNKLFNPTALNELYLDSTYNSDASALLRYGDPDYLPPIRAAFAYLGEEDYILCPYAQFTRRMAAVAGATSGPSEPSKEETIKPHRGPTTDPTAALLSAFGSAPDEE